MTGLFDLTRLDSHKVVCGRPSIARAKRILSGVATSCSRMSGLSLRLIATAGPDGVRRSDPNRLPAL